MECAPCTYLLVLRLKGTGNIPCVQKTFLLCRFESDLTSSPPPPLRPAGTIFILFFVVDMVAVSEGSSTAVPFVWILALLVLWFGVSSPLVFVGSYFGFKKDAITVPVRTNQIAR